LTQLGTDLQIPVQIVRELNEAQDLHDVLRICSGGSSTSWRSISTYGYLLWQIRSYQEEDLAAARFVKMSRNSHDAGSSTGNTEASVASREKTATHDDMMQSDAPAQHRKSSLRLDRRAACSPRPVPVRVPQPRDPEALHYPTCTDVDRCAGCCGHQLLGCRPLAVRHVTRQASDPLLGSRCSVDFASRSSFKSVDMCFCLSMVRPHHCSSGQVYREELCRCVCPNGWMAANCSHLHVWDGRRCACVCQNTELQCSTGFRFDHGVCR
ncbi:unnamed protein product, partial [Ixodes hexagonus]